MERLLPLSAIDTHVHVGDNDHSDGGLKRYFSITELNQYCLMTNGLMIVAKAHFLPFVPESQFTHGSTTLNSGFCPEQIYQTAKEMSKAWVVWFPTLNAAAHHEAVGGDDAWRNLFQGVALGESLSILSSSGELTSQVVETLHAIKEAKAILATGHLFSEEVKRLVDRALDIGVRAVVLTHVSSRHNRLDAEDQLAIINKGKSRGIPVFSEHCAITWFDGKEGAYDLERDFTTPIKLVGPENCIVSSDCGRVVPLGSVKPVTPLACLEEFSQLLLQKGLKKEEIYQMIVTNPTKLLS